MIALSDYIDDYAEVRAALGVTDLELPDETLELSMYARTLQIALSSTTGTFSGTTGSLISIYDALSVLPTPDAGQELMLFLIKEYALYVVAESLLPTLGMFATRRLSDGKAAGERFSGHDLSEKTVAEQIRARLSSLASQLNEHMGVAVESPMLLVLAQPEDRVTTA